MSVCSHRRTHGLAIHLRRQMGSAALATPQPNHERFDSAFNSAHPTAGRGRRRRTNHLNIRSSLDSTTSIPQRSTIPPPLPFDQVDNDVMFLPDELEKRIQALDVAAADEETLLTPYYTESDLMSIYEDLLAPPSTQQQQQLSPMELQALQTKKSEEDLRVVEGTETRLLESYKSPFTSATEMETGINVLQGETYQRVVAKAQEIVKELESVRKLAEDGVEEQTQGQDKKRKSKVMIPVSVLSVNECDALVRVCTRARDGPAALQTLEIMKKSGMPISESSITSTLEILANTGNVNLTESLISNFISSQSTPPTPYQRHLHIKAHLKSTPPTLIPESALSVLHTYEETGNVAPMQTYTSLITRLFSNPSSISRAQAWDLFSHMRYVAHPEPDVLLYTLMIRACANPLISSRTSEPEKALDFWTEMVVDKKIEPSVGAYNAVILACSRSGKKRWVNEAYRLAKEMVDGNRDAFGNKRFRPDRKTWGALLEGAKRIGDLGRARWILAESVRNDDDDDGNDNGVGMRSLEEEVEVGVEGGRRRMLGIDEEIMMHLFQTYASYKVPFKRGKTVVVKEEDNVGKDNDDVAENVEELELGEGGHEGATDIVLDSTPSFSHIPPQSHEEVLQEVAFLFQRILHDTGILKNPSSSQSQQEQDDISTQISNKFAGVIVTPRLVSSYISVFFNHASLELARSMFWKVFDQLGIEKTPRVLVEALERCAYSKKRGREREVAKEFGDEVWKNWVNVEFSLGENGNGGGRIDPRLIERAHAARIRLLSITNEIEKAMDSLTSFVHKYPPNSIRTSSTSQIKPLIRSTRTTLIGKKPLVRLISNSDVPDDHVPPLLTFRELEILHHRLVVKGKMEKEIAFVKWVAKAYEWMLRVRRDEGFKSKPRVLKSHT